jgi:colanic acid biosynthesis glycosyl transferase WcaI
MNILFIVSVFPPEGEPSAVMAEELSCAWVQSGHRVTVVCPFPNRPHGVIHPGFKRTWRFKCIVNGIIVVRLWTWLIGRRRTRINRLLENLTFGFSSSIYVLLAKRPEVVVLETWPLIAQLCVLLVCLLRGIPLINYVKDLYPEVLSAAGILGEHSRLHRFLLGLDAFTSRRSTHTVAISDSVRHHVAKTRKVDQLSVIRDWLNLDTIRPFPGQSRWRNEIGLRKEDFVFMYAGTIGHASKVDVLCEAARQTASASDIRIVCIGEGILKARMLEEQETFNLTNLLILPFQPRERVSEVLSSADVMLMLASRNLRFSSVPSKFITYLAAGKPMICSVDATSEIGMIVRENGLGFVVEPEDPRALANAMRTVSKLDRACLREMGARAREFAVNNYSLQRATKDFDRLFSSLEVLSQDWTSRKSNDAG